MGKEWLEESIKRKMSETKQKKGKLKLIYLHEDDLTC